MIAKELVGRDLFTWEEGTWANNNIVWPDMIRPRFCCLGAGGWGFNKPAAFKAKPTRNETSILSLLYWPSDKRASYWTGGDGFPQLTQYLVDGFFEKSKLLPIKVIKLDHHGSSKEFSAAKNKKLAVSFMSEGFFTMALAAKPEKVIVTPGDSYGHPCKLKKT